MSKFHRMMLLILGLSGSGKSTAASLVAQKYKFQLIEADDAVEKANGGVWPEGNDDFITKVFEATNEEVLLLDNLIYVTSWLEKERIRQFYEKGFAIIEMHAEFEELMRRKELRDGISEKRRARFTKTYSGYFETILSDEMKKLYTLSIDTTKLTPKEINVKISEEIHIE